MTSFILNNFGPIKSASLELGDLTILVGPQASGKSLFLEMFKLYIDFNAIIARLKSFNYIIPKGKEKKPNINELLDLYLGNGLGKCWREDSVWQSTLKVPSSSSEERVFYIPAQRILSIADGRPKNFAEFDSTAPYVLKQFSEILRAFLAAGFGRVNDVIFPIKARLKGNLKKSFNSSIFHDGKIIRVNSAGQLKMYLEVNDMQMPFMTWSAGQKEFTPLLLGFYCLSSIPTAVPKEILNPNYEYVIIEEPEMGLHPQAILAVMEQILELIQQGKKVIISTHSTLPMEFAWAFNQLKNAQGSQEAKELDLLKLFGADSSVSCQTLFQNIFSKNIKTYFFSRNETSGLVTTKDISSLDAWDADSDIGEWGGLSSFASRVGDAVAKYSQEEEV